MAGPDAGHRPFMVYPQPSGEPLLVAAGAMTEVALTEQLAGAPLPGQPYTQMMFLRIAATGSTVEPSVAMIAGSGDPVALKPTVQSIYRGPENAGFVGDAWIERDVDGVYLVSVGFEALTVEAWRLRIGNTDSAHECRFTIVVAGHPDHTRQSWIDVSPPELNFDVAVDGTEATDVTVTNFGTTKAAVTAVGPLPSALVLSTALPVEIPPTGAERLKVVFTAPSTPPVPNGVMTGAATVAVTPPDTATTGAPGHNGNLAFRAKTRWPAPRFANPGTQFTPATGPPGTPVTLSGTGLDVSGLVVRFGDVATPPNASTDTTIEVAVPDGLPAAGELSQDVVVHVVTDGGSATSDDVFTVVAQPREEVDMPGVIYAVNAENDLLWYRHEGVGNGKWEWTDDSPRKVGTGWDFKHVVSGGGGVIYAVNAADELLWYHHDGHADGGPEWTANTGHLVGTGWGVKHLFSAGGGVLYAVNANNELMWYRHEGYGSGKPEWTANTGRRVGTGWDFKHLVSGGGGVIYAVNANNDLLWYRHDGVGNGKWEWTDNAPRKVGTGWGFKHLIAAGGGVLYGINADNDLMWHRHHGLGNGKWEWAFDTGHKVGTGWNFKQVITAG
jgi:hypothetical protein